MEHQALDITDADPYPRNGLEKLGVVDSQNNIFFARELEEILPEVLEVKYARLNARDLFAIKTVKPTTKTVTYRQHTGTGIVVFYQAGANDIPLVKGFAEEFSSRVRGVANATGWTIDEIEEAAETNTPLERGQVNAANRAHRQEENNLAFNGDASRGIVGFFSDPNIPETATPGPAWSGATGLQIVTDMFACVNAIAINTKENHAPTRLVMPRAQFNIANETLYVSTTDNTTAMQFFKANASVPNIEVVVARECVGAGPGGEDVMFAYDPNIDNQAIVLAMDFRQEAPQQNDLSIKTIYRSKFGGLLVFIPAASHICYGI